MEVLGIVRVYMWGVRGRVNVGEAQDLLPPAKGRTGPRKRDSRLRGEDGNVP